MKTIVVPTDFSENSFHASLFAGQLAKAISAQVVLLNVYIVPNVSLYELPAEIEAFIRRSHDDSTAALQEFTQRFIQTTGLPVSRVQYQAEYGFVADKVVSVAQQLDASYIVMGTKGAHNVLDRWLGTNAQRVVEQSTCGVWVIPAKASVEMPSQVLYGADLEEDEQAAIAQFMQHIKPLGAQGQVLHIHESFAPNVGHVKEVAMAGLAENFEKEEMTFKKLKREDIVEGLETYLQHHHFDALALAVHDKGFWDSILSPSVTKHFVQQARLAMFFFKK
jgi:nucleotide-binding universal stress UspA family protein